MAFEGLSDKLENTFKKLRGKGRLTEDDVREAMREVKLALLEADVSFKVVKSFIRDVTDRAIGADVLDSLTPAQMIIKIVNEELCKLMGGDNQKIKINSKPPTIVMMVGLQGAGKTTNCAKLAGLMKKQGKRPILVACDVYRPAAIKQLEVVGKQLEIAVFQMGTESPVKIAKAAVEYAKKNQYDMVFLDTAGRLDIDEALMTELKNIKEAVHPDEIMLVLDAMIGQVAVDTAKNFNDLLDIDSVMLTKLDGDARGGAALSVKAITGKPIKYCGIGEKLDQIEPFYPDRMASRILGMGDMLTLIEKAEQAIDEKKAKEMAEKMKKNRFSLQDYLEQLDQIGNMGSMEDILSMIPGMKGMKDVKIDEKAMAHTRAIILSMTMKERDNPNLMNFSRKRRVAAGSGTTVEEINKLLKSYDMMKNLMKQMNQPGAMKKMKRMGGFPGKGGFGGFPGF